MSRSVVRRRETAVPLRDVDVAPHEIDLVGPEHMSDAIHELLSSSRDTWQSVHCLVSNTSGPRAAAISYCSRSASVGAWMSRNRSCIGAMTPCPRRRRLPV